MDVKYEKGDTVVVSEEFVDYDVGVSKRAKGTITGVLTGVGGSRANPLYSIDFENGRNTHVHEDNILGYEGQFNL